MAQREIVGSTQTVTYLTGDHLGSIAMLMDPAGQPVLRQDYTPFGEVRYQIGTVGTAALYRSDASVSA